jgi:hypothetical protein
MFKKVPIRTLEAKKQNVDFVATCFAGYMDFFGNQQPTVVYRAAVNLVSKVK